MPTAQMPADEVPSTDGGAGAAEGIELACGACGTTLIAGAAFCGECGTPVAQLDEEPFDLVEEVPMADLEHADYGEYVEELPSDDAPAVLYSGADGPASETPPADAEGDGDEGGAGAAVIAQPAAVLYADPSDAEPLPPTPTGSFAISEPTFGSAEGAIAGSEDAVAPTGSEPSSTDSDPSGAPLVAGAAAAGGAAVIGAELAGNEAAGAAGSAPADAAALADAGALTGAAPTVEGGEPPATVVGETTSPWADAPAADATAAGDAPTTVEPAVIGGAAAAGAAVAAGSAGTPTAPVAAGDYGTTPPPSDGDKSKTGLIIGVAAAVVVVLIVGSIVVLSSGGNKDGAVQTAQSPSTTTAPSSTSSTSTTATTSTTEGPTTSSGPTTTEAPSTTEAPTQTTAATVATTVAPTTPRPTVTLAPPTTTIEPGRIVANPPAGSSVSIPKAGSTTITLQNVGASPAGCALTGSNGIVVTQNCSPSIPPGGVVTVVVTASPTWEGPATVTGVLEGAGSYLLTVNVRNN